MRKLIHRIRRWLSIRLGDIAMVIDPTPTKRYSK